MYGHRISRSLKAVLLAVMLVSPVLAAETWSLGKGEDWQGVSENPQGRYQLEVSQMKTLVNEGRADELPAAVAKLKRDYPGIAGADLDAFVAAEKKFAAGELVGAFRAYDSFLAKYPGSELHEAALDREFAIGQAYLGGEKKKIFMFIKIKGYAEGVKIMDKVIDRAGDSPIAVKANIAVADSYEKRGKFENAYERWSMVSSRWPTGQTGKNALLNMARCQHAAYRSPEYDSSYLISAKSYYENYRKRYPEDSKRYEIDKRISQIDEQLAYKEYTIAHYYQRTDSSECAKIYCENVQKNWPDSTGAKMSEDIIEDIGSQKENAPEDPKKQKKEKKWLDRILP